MNWLRGSIVRWSGETESQFRNVSCFVLTTESVLVIIQVLVQH